MKKTFQGVDVPAVGFGTFTLQGNECRDAVFNALEIGYRHIDTAQSYENEEMVGNAIEESSLGRDEIFVTSKILQDRLQAEEVRKSTEESLQKLKLDYLDLMLIHWPNPDIPLEETLSELSKLKEEGLIKNLGVSNFPPSLMLKALEMTQILCNQIEYHPYLGQQMLLDIAEKHDVMITAYSPIAQGKVMQDETLRSIAGKHDKNPAQIALRWLIQQPQVVTVPRSKDEKHRRENFDILDFELNHHEMQQIFELDRQERIVNPPHAPDWER